MTAQTSACSRAAGLELSSADPAHRDGFELLAGFYLTRRRSVTAQLVERYGVHHRVAQLAVSRGVHQACSAIADRDSDTRRGFIAAVNVLSARPSPRLKFKTLAELERLSAATRAGGQSCRPRAPSSCCDSSRTSR